MVRVWEGNMWRRTPEEGKVGSVKAREGERDGPLSRGSFLVAHRSPRTIVGGHLAWPASWFRWWRY